MNTKISTDINYPNALFPKSFHTSIAEDMQRERRLRIAQSKEGFRIELVKEGDGYCIYHYDGSRLDTSRTYINGVLEEINKDFNQEIALYRLHLGIELKEIKL